MECSVCKSLMASISPHVAYCKNCGTLMIFKVSHIPVLVQRVQSLAGEHGDDLCWMPADINKVLSLLNLQQDLKIKDKFAMAKNCFRYIDCLESGGDWKSYAELEKELAQTKEAFNNLVNGINALMWRKA